LTYPDGVAGQGAIPTNSISCIFTYWYDKGIIANDWTWLGGSDEKYGNMYNINVSNKGWGDKVAEDMIKIVESNDLIILGYQHASNSHYVVISEIIE